MRNWTRWVLFCIATFDVAAQVELKALDQDMTGPRTQVLVLGTVHLSELPNGVAPAALDEVLDRLAIFKPDIITIEALSGEECDLAARHPAKYGSDYCRSTEVAKTATGLDVPAAMAEVEKILANWPLKPTVAERRRLIATMLAANDAASAYVQWLQLPVTKRKSADGLPATLVVLLTKIEKSHNENYVLAARLAARLGLQRLYATDNHTGDNILYSDRDAFGRAVMAAWNLGKTKIDDYEKQLQPMTTSASLLPLYRFVNTSAYLQALAEVNVSAALRAKSAQGYPQIWVHGWEIRNLRMVANISETFREKPGARVLSVVGASHKPWFDHWLGQLQAVDIVKVSDVLK